METYDATRKIKVTIDMLIDIDNECSENRMDEYWEDDSCKTPH